MGDQEQSPRTQTRLVSPRVYEGNVWPAGKQGRYRHLVSAVVCGEGSHHGTRRRGPEIPWCTVIDGILSLWAYPRTVVLDNMQSGIRGYRAL